MIAIIEINLKVYVKLSTMTYMQEIQEKRKIERVGGDFMDSESEDIYVNKNIADFINQPVGFSLEIKACIEEGSIEGYIKNVNEHYCNYLKTEKDKIIGVNIKDVNDEFRYIYYQLMNYIFENKTEDIFSLYVKKNKDKIEILDIGKGEIYNSKDKFYEIMAYILERDIKNLRLFIVVRDFSKEIEIIRGISRILEISNYNDKIMNISEVVSNLTHSWRQPLNSLNFSILNLKDEIINKIGDPKLVNDFYSEIWQIIKNLSCKIEKFRAFFETDYEKKDYNLLECMNLIFEIMDEKIRKENFLICMDINGDSQIYGSPNKFVQIMYCVFLDIIEYCKNTLDAFDRRLKIDINREEKKVLIDIETIFDREKYVDFDLNLEHISTFKSICFCQAKSVPLCQPNCVPPEVKKYMGFKPQMPLFAYQRTMP